MEKKLVVVLVIGLVVLGVVGGYLFLKNQEIQAPKVEEELPKEEEIVSDERDERGCLVAEGCDQASTEPSQPPEPTIVWPVLMEVEPSQAEPGERVHLVGQKGYTLLPDGGYNESSRDFTLYFDDQPIGVINCCVNRCEGNLTVPVEALPGEHEIAVEGGSRLLFRVVELR